MRMQSSCPHGLSRFDVHLQLSKSASEGVGAADELECLQASGLAQYSAENVGSNFKGLLLLTCVNALLYNLVHYLMIQRTSAVTTTVLGEIKIIGLLFA